MRIATWNVNSINARLETALAWFTEHRPDVACLQELKCIDEKFPREPFEALGYNIETNGQKTYNGVALLSKYPMSDVRRGLPGEDLLGGEADHARYIEAVIETPRPVRVASIYLPNGNPVASEKFPYKLRWFERLTAHARELLALEEALVLAGDYNVIPAAEDADKPEGWVGDALYQPESRSAFRAIKALGLYDPHEVAGEPPGTYTFWDYTGGAFDRDHGIRIDFALMSPQATDRFQGLVTHRDARAMERPSDHVPVEITLDD